MNHRCSGCGKELPSEHSEDANYLCSRCMNEAKQNPITKFGERQ